MIQSTIHTPLRTAEAIDAIIDIGTTTHCLCINSPYKLEIQTRNGLKATHSDGTKIQATAECELDMENIPRTVRKVHKFPRLAGNSLISVAQLCDAGCEVTFYHDKLTVTKDNKDIAEGYRETKTTLWRRPITTPKAKKEHTNKHMHTPTAQINYVMPEGNMEEVMTYPHKYLGSPKTSTLLSAVENNNLTTCPALTTTSIKKCLSNSV